MQTKNVSNLTNIEILKYGYANYKNQLRLGYLHVTLYITLQEWFGCHQKEEGGKGIG